VISSAGAAWFGGWRERSGWRTAQRLARAAAGARVGFGAQERAAAV